jgi:hypothetical protein
MQYVAMKQPGSVESAARPAGGAPDRGVAVATLADGDDFAVVYASTVNAALVRCR